MSRFTGVPMAQLKKIRMLCSLWLLLGLVACASLPPSVQGLAWRDAWGDRGSQVLAREYAGCADAVESRRSQLSACMAHRGWLLDTP